MGFITRMQVARKMKEMRRQQRAQDSYVMERARLEQQNETLRLEERRKAELDRLRADQHKLKEQVGPSKMQKFGQGIAKVMNKGKQGMGKVQNGLASAKSKGFMQGVKVGAPASTGSKGLDNTPVGSPFGGQRNIEVGGRGLFNTTPVEKPKEKRTTIIIKQ